MQPVSLPLPIVADVPTDTPALGFPVYARALADAIRGGEPAQFTVGLYGPWGSGKSSLLRSIERCLAEHRDEVITIEFDAWRYERTDHIVVPLVHRLKQGIAASGGEELVTAAKTALSALIFSLKFNLGVLELDTSKVAGQLPDSDDAILDAAFSRPFEWFRKISERLSGRRIVVLIDDLDRCSPENVVRVLESINLVMDVPGFVFVLALDYDVLVSAIRTRYPHVEGDVFIQKLIQLPFRVPRLDLTDDAFLKRLIPEITRLSGELPRETQFLIRSVATLGLNANPRQIKRLVNSYLLLRRIMDEKQLMVDTNLLIPLLGLQLAWPAYYGDLHDAVVLGDPKPLSRLQENEDDPALSRYAEGVLAGDWTAEALRQILQLTEVFGEAEWGQSQSTKEERRQERFAQLTKGLLELGYERSSRSDRLFYHPARPNRRVAFGKTNARLEQRRTSGSGRDWVLVDSFWISQWPEGLKWLSKQLPRKGA